MTDDLEVGRFAVRTFRMDSWRGIPESLCSVQLGTGHWNGGFCVASCLAELMVQGYTGYHGYPRGPYFGFEIPEHPVPDLRCTCGIYGALSLEALDRQYDRWSTDFTAVIAAEGRTIIGTRGLRTERARVVAYYFKPMSSFAHQIDLFPPGNTVGIFPPVPAVARGIANYNLDMSFPDAKVWEDRCEMARHYGIDVVEKSSRQLSSDYWREGESLWREGEKENG